MSLLPAGEFRYVVERAPIVSIDLLVLREGSELLVGRRRNPPARGEWFVPGGRVFKGETLDAAFARISAVELGVELPIASALPFGNWEHFYDEGFDGSQLATHYIVLAYRLNAEIALQLPTDQHHEYAWLPISAEATQPVLHPYAEAYRRALASGT